MLISYEFILVEVIDCSCGGDKGALNVVVHGVVLLSRTTRRVYES